MNTKILLAIPISVLAVACAPQAPAPALDSRTLHIPTCNLAVVNPVININLAAAAPNPINPPIMCVNKGATVKFKVTPVPAATATVATIPKNPANSWMYATNSAASPGECSFTVPAALPKGNYDYMVVSGKGFCVDPRIRVP